MNAFVASAVQAAPVVTTSAGNVAVHGTSESVGEKLTIDGVTFECKAGHWTGTWENGKTTYRLTKVETGCTAAGTGMTTHINTSGCHILFHFEKRHLFPPRPTAWVDYECTENESVTISGTGTSCEVQIGSQTGLKSVEVTNDATDVTMKPNVSGIVGNVTKDGFLCPFSGTGVKPVASGPVLLVLHSQPQAAPFRSRANSPARLARADEWRADARHSSFVVRG
jgi:hypothetical protein